MIHAVITKGGAWHTLRIRLSRILLWDGTLNKNFTGKTFDCSAFVQYIFYKGQ